MKRIFLPALIVLFPLLSRAGKVYEFNALCQQAYQEITKLKLNNAQVLLNKAAQQNPDNLVPVALANYIDFYTLFFNEDPAQYKVFQQQVSRRIALLKQGPESSPFYNFYLGMIYLQKAGVAMRFGEKWSAGWDFKRGYGYVKQNKKSFPTFTPNDLLYGPMQAIVGTIPSGYKWIAGLFGMKGSIKNGMRLIGGFMDSPDPWARLFFNEAAFLNCYLMFYIANDKDAVFELIRSRKLDVVNNHLFTYMAANLGIHNKMSAYAEEVLNNRNKSPEYLATNAWDYQMSMVKMNQLQLDDAVYYLEKFLREFRGKSFVKDACQKLSWSYYLKGNLKSAEAARKRLLASGSTETEPDKKAQKDARSGTWPNLLLLRARLLSDGGYHQQALQVLNGKTKNDFQKTADQLELVYRLGRIHDDLKQYNEAIYYYQQAIDIGYNRSEYFAARAALQAGQIYESLGKKSTAIAYYEKCLDMEDHEYEDSIEQRAKAGIQRCKGE
ncbi:MAG TPA: tetratricopeptide repeat protein [Chitinophagaceae bacterium]